MAGLLSLAIGLPNRHGDESGATVLDDLLAAQVACLVGALSIAFVAESIRCAADIVDDQSMLLAGPGADHRVAGLVAATVVGPFETTRVLSILLNGWLPPVVDDTPRAQFIDQLLPDSVGRTAARHLGDLGLRGLAARRVEVHPSSSPTAAAEFEIAHRSRSTRFSI